MSQKDQGHSPLAIFDLDSTLFEVRFRSTRILQIIAELPEMVSQWPEECRILGSIDIQAGDWGIREPMIRSGLKASLDFFEAVRNHWRERFFSSDFLSIDQPYEGAVDYVNSLHQKGIDIAYLTGRDQVRMGPGTQDSLEQWNFPFSTGENPGRLYCKPHTQLTDRDFKERFFKALQHNHEEVWFFENEASIIELVGLSSPKVNIIFINTIHSGETESPTHLPTISGRFSIKD